MIDSCAALAAANSVSRFEIVLSSVLHQTIQADQKSLMENCD